MLFNRYMANLIIQLREKGHMTRKTQTVYNSSIGFFIGMRWLKQNGLIVENGIDDDRFKIWVLNEKGVKIAEHLKQIRDILKEQKK